MARRAPLRLAGLALAAGTALALTAGVATAAGPPDRKAPPGQQDRADFTLTVLHNNDAESALLGREVDGEPYGGAARFVTLVRQEQKAALTGRPVNGAAAKRGVVTVSGGDNFLPGPEFAASLEPDAPTIYDALAFAAVDYDVSALGNHDFDFGPELLADFIRADTSETPFLKTNLDVSAEPDLQKLVDEGRLVDTYVVKERGERIGFIGLTTPELPRISSPRGVEVSAELAEIVNAEVAAFEDAGVNKIILVSHLQDIENERALVPQIDGVDLVVGAGGGELLAAPGDQVIPGDEIDGPYPYLAADLDGTVVPVVTTTGNYEYLGRTVLHFNRAGEVVGWDQVRTGVLRVSGTGADAVQPDGEVLRTVEEPVAAYVETLAEEVVATSEVDLNGVRNDIRSQETNLGNLVADALRWAGETRAAEFGTVVPQVGVQNGGGIRNDSVIPAGNITALDTYDIAPFGNFVSVIPQVPRETFRSLLERGVSDLPGPAGQFIQISGASFTYDVTQPAQEVDTETGEIVSEGSRIRSVVLDDGTVIVENGAVVAGDPIAVATNDFSARGGDTYPLGDLEFTSVGLTYQAALQQYLEAPAEEGGLGGTVTAEEYPVGGEGRIEAV